MRPRIRNSLPFVTGLKRPARPSQPSGITAGLTSFAAFLNLFFGYFFAFSPLGQVTVAVGRRHFPRQRFAVCGLLHEVHPELTFTQIDLCDLDRHAVPKAELVAL